MWFITENVRRHSLSIEESIYFHHCFHRDCALIFQDNDSAQSKLINIEGKDHDNEPLEGEDKIRAKINLYRDQMLETSHR
jgi:hypothetical protein